MTTTTLSITFDAVTKHLTNSTWHGELRHAVSSWLDSTALFRRHEVWAYFAGKVPATYIAAIDNVLVRLLSTLPTSRRQHVQEAVVSLTDLVAVLDAVVGAGGHHDKHDLLTAAQTLVDRIKVVLRNVPEEKPPAFAMVAARTPADIPAWWPADALEDDAITHLNADLGMVCFRAGDRFLMTRQQTASDTALLRTTLEFVIQHHEQFELPWFNGVPSGAAVSGEVVTPETQGSFSVAVVKLGDAMPEWLPEDKARELRQLLASHDGDRTALALMIYGSVDFYLDGGIDGAIALARGGCKIFVADNLRYGETQRMRKSWKLFGPVQVNLSSGRGLTVTTGKLGRVLGGLSVLLFWPFILIGGVLWCLYKGLRAVSERR